MISNRCVVIVQRRLTKYRVPLFVRLRTLLADDGIKLRLLVGKPDRDEVLKRDEGQIDWAEEVPTDYWREICWQPFGRQVVGANLVIVTQENRLLYNLLAMTITRPYLLAFWGHGRNMQSTKPQGFKERFKRWTTNKVDWWFAYTEMTRNFLIQDEFPSDRITVLDNAVDTTVLRNIQAGIAEQDKVRIKHALGIGNGPVGVFLGSLYASKRLAFLLDSVTEIRKRFPSFCLLVVGDGPDRQLVEEAASTAPWIKVLGSRHEKEKMEVLSIADVLLNPGGVGLGILDSFVSGVPMITTDCGNHGPEIAYLRNKVNGVMTDDSVEAFTQAVIGLLGDTELLGNLRVAALECGDRYTIEKMALKFRDGILSALEN